jgi:hypothetical protein
MAISNEHRAYIFRVKQSQKNTLPEGTKCPTLFTINMCNIPEYFNLQQHCCKNLTSHKKSLICPT